MKSITILCSIFLSAALWSQTNLECSEEGCQGQYIGAEFISGSDVAHQFSNTMCKHVGDELKRLYQAGIYVVVDFEHVVMSTAGMGTGHVTYYLKIPFKRVAEECEAYTSFDHVGGWNHSPELVSRKRQLNKALMTGEELNVSPLFTTAEGLQEYWIQWRNKVTQADCDEN